MKLKNKGDMLGAIIALILGILNMLAVEGGLIELPIGLVAGTMSCLVLMVCSMRLDLLYFDEGTILYQLNRIVQNKGNQKELLADSRKESILINEVKQPNMDHLLKGA